MRAGVKVCYCLTDFPGPRCGITMFARGSHRLREPLGIPEGEVDPPAMVELTPRAGDAVLFENRTFHSVAPNTSDCVSKVVIYGYAYRWMRVDPSLRLPDAELAEDAGPVEKQLLGGRPRRGPAGNGEGVGAGERPAGRGGADDGRGAGRVTRAGRNPLALPSNRGLAVPTKGTLRAKHTKRTHSPCL